MNYCDCLIEEWRDVVGYDGKYKVSSCGRVVSFKHKKEGKLMKLTLKENNYLIVGLWKDNVGVNYYVHQLIAEYFVGPCPPGREVNHKDINKRNNCYTNLEYVTRKENIDHAIANGLGITQLYAIEGRTHSKAQVLAIKADWDTGLYTRKQLAEMYSVGYTYVQQVVAGTCRARVI